MIGALFWLFVKESQCVTSVAVGAERSVDKNSVDKNSVGKNGLLRITEHRTE